MSEEEDSGRVKAQGDNDQIPDQDTVRLITGSWVREQYGKWIFDSLSEEGRYSVTLFPGLEYEDLVQMVKSILRIVAPNVTIKLSYQYPSWMQIDEGDGLTPQFISDDYDVEPFVQMRCKIEEVNLYVTISEHNNGLTTEKTRPPFASVTHQTLIRNEDEEESEADDMLEEEWLQFAMSETPLTCPHKKNDVGGSFAVPGNQTIPNVQRGIVIREPIIRLASPPREPLNKGKGKAIATEGDTDAPTLNCLLPETSINKGAYGGNGESSQAIRRHLFDGPIVPSNRAVEVDDHTNAQGETIEAQTVVGPSGVAPPSSVYTWTRFQDALHDILYDESSEPVLFARDAPPVIDSGKEDAARAYTVQGFNKVFITIQRVSPGCAAYLVDIGRANIRTDSLVAAAYYADTWHSTYEEKIYPIPSVGGNEIGGEYAGDLLPPEVRRPPGRPQKVCILSWGQDKVW
ncbi:hypothetical protein Bca101_088079 [Brassica carinata]